MATPDQTNSSGGGSTEQTIIDDKSPVCIPFILERLREYRAASGDDGGGGATVAAKRPFFIGLNGVQGVGKTTLVKALAAKLREDEGLETLVCSIDDFYLTHADQKALAAAHPDNRLVQVRGEPGRLTPPSLHRPSLNLVYNWEVMVRRKY